MSDSDKAAQATSVNEALVRASSHPVAFAIARVLAERGKASGKEIAAAVAKPRSTVGDLLRKLEEDRLIECVTEEPKRGTVERYYRLTPLAHVVEDAEVGQISAADKRRMGIRQIQALVTDASAALAADTLDRRDDWCLGAMRVTVDERGWTELAKIHRRALDEVTRVREESEERLVEGAEKPLRALSALLLFELPHREE